MTENKKPDWADDGYLPLGSKRAAEKLCLILVTEPIKDRLPTRNRYLRTRAL